MTRKKTMTEKEIDADMSVSLDEKMVSLMHEIFHLDSRGKELLEMLQQKYIQSPTAISFENANQLYFREGENNIIRIFAGAKKIKQQVKESRANLKNLKTSIKS